MATLLLMIIYLAFISLGLPDTVLGVAWPQMRLDFNVPLDASGLIFIAITGSTIISSILSGYLIKKLGTHRVTYISIFLTAFALFMISIVPSFYFMILLAIPLGFGAGSIDTALNNYVASHYKSHHMNWLHAFWGIGATIGPIIISTFFLLDFSWRNGYATIGIIQFVIFLIVLFSYKLWKTNRVIEKDNHESIKGITYKDVLKTKGVLLAMSLFVLYCAIEFGVGNWGASYLVSVRSFDKAIAGTLLGTYYAGITVGRITSGFVSFKFSNKQMIIFGILLFIGASSLLVFNVPLFVLYILFFLQGSGLAPIFPSLIHETPVRFEAAKSQHIIGLQMASAYTGASIFPALFGVLARHTTLQIYPYYILILGGLLFFLNSTLNSKTKEQ